MQESRPMDPVLKIADLSVKYLSRGGAQSWAVRDLECEVNRGEIVGILGESGSGKSTLAHAVLGVLPAAAQVESGSIRFQDRELLGLPESEMRRIRGAQIALIQQDPATALNPLLRVGAQVADVISAHYDWGRRRCREAAEKALAAAGLANTGATYSAYPHQLSGGQLQRVVIAQALACNPALLIADEPTSALDTTLQLEILSLLKRLGNDFGLTILFISHNPAVLAEVADRIFVLYAGQVVEDGSAQEILTSPLHPYTRALLECGSHQRADGDESGLPEWRWIAGVPPDLHALPPVCAFRPRCKELVEVCALRLPKAIRLAPGRSVRCLKYGG